MGEQHGYRGTPTYNTWMNMRVRCRPGNSNSRDNANYFERGIRVCLSWDNSFLAFLQDMGERPDGMTLDRINHDGDYCKENCKWSTVKEQIRNTRANRMITYNGVTKCLIEWAEQYDIQPGTLGRRLDKGWAVDKAMTHPVNIPQKGVTHNQKLISYRGERLNMKEWAKRFNMDYTTLNKRVRKYGMSFEEAVTRPVGNNGRKKPQR
jgi:hypothetical protein